MHLGVLACDYDNTLATRGVASAATVSALRSVAASGRRLVLVTGRVLAELSEVFPDLDLFDRVVAENGGLVWQPATGRERLLGPEVPDVLVAELRAADVQPLGVGRVICATVVENEARALAAVSRSGVDRRAIRNKDSLMLLPFGVDKAAGLDAALDELHQTFDATVAVGDAENDVALLRAARVGVAVENALDVVKEHADLVLDRPDGEGVAALCRALLDGDLATAARRR